MEIKFNRLELNVNLKDGTRLSSSSDFHDGCNIILTDSNTKGKSTLLNSIMFALGFDNIVNKSIPALTNPKIKYKGQDRDVKSSYIKLEIENEKKEVLSIKRETYPTVSRGIDVYLGPLPDWNDQQIETFHLGQGSYQNQKGFHRRLYEFIGYNPATALNTAGEEKILYLEYIFSEIFIEQKRGWSQIMANVPPYSLKEAKKITTCKNLGMSWLEDSIKKEKLKFEMSNLKVEYKTRFESEQDKLRMENYYIVESSNNIDRKPDSIDIVYADGEQSIKLRKKELQEKLAIYLNENNIRVSEELKKLSDEIISKSNERKGIANKLKSLLDNLDSYKNHQLKIKKDLQRHTEERIMENLARKKVEYSPTSCPTCKQEINGILQPSIPADLIMDIDENISYLREQQKMLTQIIEREGLRCHHFEINLDAKDKEIEELYSKQNRIQKSLAEALPADTSLIHQEKARLEYAIEKIDNLEISAKAFRERLIDLHDQYLEREESFKKLERELSDDDKELLKKFETSYKNYLSWLGYQSFENKYISIETTSFMPRLNLNSIEFHNETNDRTSLITKTEGKNSASDSIREIMAYTLALHACRKNSPASQHPNVSIFDEPYQQNIGGTTYNSFFEIASEIAKDSGQVIIAATRNRDIPQLEEELRRLNYNIIDLGSDHILK